MSSSQTSSKKRDAETIHVAGSPNAKRAKRLRVSLACAEVSRCFPFAIAVKEVQVV